MFLKMEGEAERLESWTARGNRGLVEYETETERKIERERQEAPYK